MSGTESNPTHRIAYLNTQYPSLSHTFIEREIRAVREAGIAVQPFSIRRPDSSGLLSPEHQEAERETVYILDGIKLVLAAQAWGIATRPLRYLRVLWTAMTMSPPGMRRRLLYIMYAAEAVRLAKEMLARRLSHVHVHMANNGASVARLATCLADELSYSMTVHGSAEFFNVENERLGEKAESALFVRCISNFCRAQIMAWASPRCWDRLHVVRCGIDASDFPSAESSAEDDTRPLRLLTVGRLHPIKGYGLLLKACAELDKQNIEWSLDIVGDGPMRPELQRTARDLGISDRVTFSGAVGGDRILSHYHAAEIFVLSSFMEGVPVVLMEAMAAGKPVIATRVGGVAELVEDGVSGWLVPPGSAEALADTIAVSWSRRKEFGDMGRRGRERVLREYSARENGSAVAELFKSYLAHQQQGETGLHAWTSDSTRQYDDGQLRALSGHRVVATQGVRR